MNVQNLLAFRAAAQRGVEHEAERVVAGGKPARRGSKVSNYGTLTFEIGYLKQLVTQLPLEQAEALQATVGNLVGLKNELNAARDTLKSKAPDVMSEEMPGVPVWCHIQALTGL